MPNPGYADATHCRRGHELTPDNLYSPPSRKGKLWCRVCMNQRSAKYKGSKNAQQREIRDAMRKRAISFLGMCCTYCGSFDGLQLDHIAPHCRDGEKKPEQWDEWKRASLGHAENLQLLCGECHKGKTAHDWLVSATPVRRAAFERAVQEHEMEVARCAA